MEKELWLDKQEIEQLLSGSLFWQDVQNRADIKIMHKPKEDPSTVEEQKPTGNFMRDELWGNRGTEQKSAAVISKDRPGQDRISEISEAEKDDGQMGIALAEPDLTEAGPVEAEIPEKESEKSPRNESEAEVKTEATETEQAAAPVPAAEERNDEEAFQTKHREGKPDNDEVQAENIEAEETAESVQNGVSLSGPEEFMEMGPQTGSIPEIEEMEKSLEKTFGNGNEFKKLILERELEKGFENRPFDGIKIVALMGIVAAITIAVWIFFLSK
ncbi:hypothetical protein Sgly_0292 [Syntrophobotulus glycolicus DSM 8271]|uniref:Uncharacterized protein n=1 Tax=Syntrophobotulus glycolicus (strain DSM 8271 / FlGlyR) TaxID=645991 RepID=F0SWW9_SYNGF|nr:hypothetical protein [Syntrophobotulus glycolicus]ADY54659.1 hypothetical protein Sgly_0292 [Syntrophobotulus glycolicus DSM 8271]